MIDQFVTRESKYNLRNFQVCNLHTNEQQDFVQKLFPAGDLKY